MRFPIKERLYLATNGWKDQTQYIRISFVVNDAEYFQKLFSIDSQQIANPQKLSIAMSSLEGQRHHLQESEGKTIKPNFPSKKMPNHDNPIIKDQKLLLDQLEHHLKLFHPSIHHQTISKMKQVYEQSMANVQQTNTVSCSELFSSKYQEFYQEENRSQRIVCSLKQDSFVQPQEIDAFLSERSIDSNICEKTERQVKYFSRKTAKKRSAVKIMPKSNVQDRLHITQAKQLTSDQIYEQNFAQNCLQRLRQWRMIFAGQNKSQCQQSDNKKVENYWNEQQKKLKEIIVGQELGTGFKITEKEQPDDL